MCCYSYYHVANGLQLVKAVFVSNSVSKPLNTVCIVCLQSAHLQTFYRDNQAPS